MPNHVEIRLFLRIKDSTDGVGQATSQHQNSENKSSFLKNGWQDKDHQPTHKEIEEEAEFFVYFFSKNFIEYTENSQSPLQTNNQIAQPATDQGKSDRRVAPSDGNVNHAMVDNPQDVFVSRSIGHGVVDGRGQKHEK